MENKGCLKLLGGPLIVILIYFLWSGIGNIIGKATCKKEIAKEIHGKISKIVKDSNGSIFYVIFIDGTRYNPYNFDFRYKVGVGDSIYKVPGEFTFYFYKNCKKENPTIFRDTCGCKQSPIFP